MLEKIPTDADMISLVKEPLFDVWMKLCNMIDEEYDVDHIWDKGGKAWIYEYKYRRGGKTLCTLYAKEDSVGLMIILGKYERERFEADRQSYSKAVQNMYDDAKTYHDGKWIMFEPTDTIMFDDFRKLLHIKRKPNKK